MNQPTPLPQDDAGQTNEFTFSNFYILLQRSFFRIVMFCVAVALVMGIVVLSVYFGDAKNTETVSIWVQLTYPGAEEGKTPDGTDLNFVSSIKSPTLIDKTLSKVGVTLGSGVSPSTIANSHFKIESVYSQDMVLAREILLEQSIKDATALKELVDLDKKITEYIITLSEYSKIGLTRDKATNFMDELIVQYQEQFGVQYLSYDLLPTEIASRLTKDDAIGSTEGSFDYLEAYDRLAVALDISLTLLEKQADQAPAFLSSKGKSFDSYAQSLALLRDSRLANLQTFVLTNGLSTDPETKIEQLALSIAEQERLKTEYSELIATINTALKEYPDSVTIITNPAGGETTIQSKDESYHEAFREVTELNKKLSAVQTEIARLTEEKGIFENPKANSNANKTLAAARIKAIATEALQLQNEANEAVREYHDYFYFQNAIKVRMPATYARNQAKNIKYLLLITVALVLLAAVVAVLITYFDNKRKGIPFTKAAQQALQASKNAPNNKEANLQASVAAADDESHQTEAKG